mgnify:CR=1 FL=1
MFVETAKKIFHPIFIRIFPVSEQAFVKMYFIQTSFYYIFIGRFNGKGEIQCLARNFIRLLFPCLPRKIFPALIKALMVSQNSKNFIRENIVETPAAIAFTTSP